MQLLSGGPRFSGKAVYPTIEAALEAQKFKPKRSIDEIRAAQKERPQLPGFTMNARFKRDDEVAFQIIEHEDQQRYPGVLVLTSDDKGDHIKEVNEDFRTTIIAQAFARLSMVGLESKKASRERASQPMDLTDLHKALAVLWDPAQVNTVKEFKTFQNKRHHENLQDLRDKLNAQIEANRAKEAVRKNRWYNRLYSWVFH